MFTLFQATLHSMSSWIRPRPNCAYLQPYAKASASIAQNRFARIEGVASWSTDHAGLLPERSTCRHGSAATTSMLDRNTGTRQRMNVVQARQPTPNSSGAFPDCSAWPRHRTRGDPQTSKSGSSHKRYCTHACKIPSHLYRHAVLASIGTEYQDCA